jgi:myotubularin-related protein 3/4
MFLKAILNTCSKDFENQLSIHEDESEEEAAPALEIDNTERKLLIIDARSYAAAVANRAKGGGCECSGMAIIAIPWESFNIVLFSEYYPSCEIQFMNLANIHTIRKSFQAVRQLCALSPDQPT